MSLAHHLDFRPNLMGCSNANNQGCNRQHEASNQEFCTIDVNKKGTWKCAKRCKGGARGTKLS
jgi:hypothetical protein